MIECPFCKSPLTQAATLGDSHGLGVCESCHNPVFICRESDEERAEAIAGATDIRRHAPEGSIGATFLKHAPAAIEELPVLPEISQKILALLRDPEFGMGELVDLVKEDSVLAVAIMKQANSAAFGGLQEIKDLNSACARLGVRNVANTVQMVANRNLFITGHPALKDNMARLWRHSIASAHCAHEIARLTLAADQETFFLAGLVHDIGKILMLEMVASPKDKLIRDLQSNPDLLREVVSSLHPLLGLLVCQAWQLPPILRSAVYLHHMPEKSPAKEWLSLSHTVSLASTIARVEGYGLYDEEEEVFLASHPSSMHLALTDIKLATLRVDFADTLDALFEAAG